MTISSPHPIQSPRISRSTCSLFALLAIAFTSSLFAQAKPKPEPDVIIFTNGDQLTGTVERGAGDSVVFRSDMAGEITVPYAKIKELRAHGAFALLRKDTKTPTTDVKEGTVAYSSSKVTLTVPTGGTETVEPKNIDFLIDKNTYDKQVLAHPGLLTGWQGAISGGATFVRSTQNGSTFTVGTTLIRAIPLVTYLPPKSKSIFNLNETYGKLTSPVIPQTDPPSPDTTVKTDIFAAGFEQDQYFSPRLYILAHTSFNHDFSQGLRLQQVYGGGIGWTVIQQPKQQLDVKADVHYEKQTFEQQPAPAVNTTDQNLIGSTISELYHRNLYKGIVFTENADALPAFNNSNAYSADATAGLVLPVYKRLGLNVSATDNFLNNPAIGFKKNSFQFVTGVTYTLP
jgi:hypothetical protein